MKLPIARSTNPPPKWEDLESPLDLEKIEAKAGEHYVKPIRNLVGALCNEIRNLRGEFSV